MINEKEIEYKLKLEYGTMVIESLVPKGDNRISDVYKRLLNQRGPLQLQKGEN